MFNPNEAKTRKALIDPALAKAGWDVNDADLVGLEIPVDDTDPQVWAILKAKLDRVKESGGTYNEKLPIGISDYALYRPSREIIAIVEAKRTSVDPRLAQAQAEFYIEQLEKRQSFRPFAFMTNGKDIYFLDPTTGSQRPVAGFFSLSELENQLFIQQNKQPLSQTPINVNITDRSYQQEAIRYVCEAFEQQNKRKALLVMATGTGKTRTVMSLIDLFLNTNQARQILFVADRGALVQQAMTDGFQKFLPDEPCERIFTYKRDRSSRLYATTLQTLHMCFQSFSPGFFDLIIFDEVHRSIFNKWNEVFQYFDARIIGLTATPAAFINRNTYLTFECENNQPTYLYPYAQAVKDGYLVDYNLYTAQTKFQRSGIKGLNLSEEARNALYRQGIDPDDVDFKGTELEKKVSNKDTLRKQWQEIWDVCYKDESGQIPGKTIVFAMTQKHALRLEEVFNQMFSPFSGMTRVITGDSDHKGILIKQFKEEDKPRIAITVDLLETGIDVPEVVNLVFMKPVHSRIKLEQMIGRGTRSQAACRYLNRLPNREKKQFLIIDFWENDFNKQASEELKQSLPVLVSLFHTRIELLEHYLSSDTHKTEQDRMLACLRAQIAQIPTDSLSVKKSMVALEQVLQEQFWRYLTADKMTFLKLKISPLLYYVPNIDVEAITFTHKVERLKQQDLSEKEALATAQSIAESVSRLPNFVFEDARYKAAADLCLVPQQLVKAKTEELDQVIDLLAGQMRNKRDGVNPFIELDLPDYVDQHGYILLQGGSEQVTIEEYKQRVDEHIMQLIGNDPTITAIERKEPVTDQQWIELERALHSKLGQSDIELTTEHVRMAYGLKVGSLIEFLRNVLELDDIPDYNDIVQRQFEEHVRKYGYNAEQRKFLSMVQNVFLQRHHLALADLYDEPFSKLGVDAVERLFSAEQINAILHLTNNLAA